MAARATEAKENDMASTQRRATVARRTLLLLFRIVVVFQVFVLGRALFIRKAGREGTGLM